MKCQNMFSGKNKKNILKCCLLKLLPSMLSIIHCEMMVVINKALSSDELNTASSRI